MATYEELEDLFNAPRLKAQTRVAVIVAAADINSEDPATANHANRLMWAKSAFANTEHVAEDVRKAVLAANKNATVAQINSATDAQVQANVDGVVDLFADGG